MKKNFISIMVIALAIMLAFTGCTAENSGPTTKTVRVIGSAVKAPAAKRAVEAADRLVIDSVDSVMVNGKDIKDDLKPVGAVKAGDNNVTFQAEVEVPSTVSFSATAKNGYVFDEWEVLEVEEGEEEEEESKAITPADPALLEKIEDWLEEGGREHKETLEDVPAEYITYLVAEYDHGYYIDLDGKDEKKLTVDAFIEKEYAEDELTLVISGSNADAFKKLMDAINAMTDLEELKLKATDASIDKIPALAKLEEIALSGFTFSTDVTINSDKMEYKFEDCTFQNLTITLAKEIEINGGSAKVITIEAAEEVEIENLTAEKLDLSKMQTGEVELENVKGEIVRPDKNSKVEIEVEKDEE